MLVGHLIFLSRSFDPLLFLSLLSYLEVILPHPQYWLHRLLLLQLKNLIRYLWNHLSHLEHLMR